MQGLNVLPAKKKLKSPKGLLEWREYQNTFPDDKKVKTWLMEMKYQNIFLILGQISNNLIELDIDVPDTTLEDLFLDDTETQKKVWISESSMGKKKIYCRTENVLDLPDKIVSNTTYKIDEKEKNPHVEYRGDNQGSILPPSIHPIGVQYKWLNLDENGELPELQIIDTEKLFNEIVEKLRKKYNYILPKEEEKKEDNQQKKRKKRPRYCFIGSHDNGDKWNSKTGDIFRVAVACELVHCNYANQEIHDFFLTHDEISEEPYDKEKTQDRLDSIRKRLLHQYGCKKLQNECKDIVEKYCNECSKQEKEDLTIYASNFSVPGGKYLEEIIQDGIECFVLYDSNTNTWEIVNDYLYGDIPIKPFIIPDEMKEAVIFPNGVEEYGTLLELQKEMDSFALEEYDPVDNKDLYGLHVILCLTSWIAPPWQRNMAEKFIPILNARGSSETGKKRYLTVKRWLTYHSLYALKTMRVPTLFRAIAPLDGTLILDEADMNDSNLNAELVEFLNSRCDGVPIPRFSSDTKKVDWWKSFGLTIMATRQGFSDDGLESRCVVMPTATTDNPGNYHLIPPKEWVEKGKRLQRKLLLFRLRHMKGEMPTQLMLPNISSFRVRESLLIIQGLKDEDKTLMARVEYLAKELQERIIKERSASPEGLILNVIYNVLSDERTYLENHGIGQIILTTVKKKKEMPDPPEQTEDSSEEIETNNYPLTLKNISKNLGEAFSPSVIAKMWRGLNQDTVSLKKIENKSYRGVILIKNIKRLDRIFPKYVVDYIRPFSFKIELGDGQKELPT
jgi:hypothetical protein